MGDYLNYISKIVGTDAMIPVVFTTAILGPIAVYILVHRVQAGWLNKLKWLVAIASFFSCLILYIGTGGYIGSQLDSPALGMGIGLVTFYFTYNSFTSLLPSTCTIDGKLPQKTAQQSVTKNNAFDIRQSKS